MKSIIYKDVDISLLDVNNGSFIKYAGKYIAIQIPFHNLNRFDILKDSYDYPTISSRSIINIEIQPEFALYHFYKKMDNFFEEYLKKKYGNIEYKPIIRIKYNKKYEYIQYFLPHRKIKISKPSEKFMQRVIQLHCDNTNDNRQTAINMYNDEISQDKYFDYSFLYKLYESTNNSREEIKFKTFDEFVSYIKYGVNIRFIIRPRLYKKYLGGKDYYYLRLDIRLIEITKKKIVNFDYDYEYILKRMCPELRIAIHAIKYI